MAHWGPCEIWKTTIIGLSSTALSMLTDSGSSRVSYKEFPTLTEPGTSVCKTGYDSPTNSTNPSSISVCYFISASFSEGVIPTIELYQGFLGWSHGQPNLKLPSTQRNLGTKMATAGFYGHCSSCQGLLRDPLLRLKCWPSQWGYLRLEKALCWAAQPKDGAQYLVVLTTRITSPPEPEPPFPYSTPPCLLSTTTPVLKTTYHRLVLLTGAGPEHSVTNMLCTTFATLLAGSTHIPPTLGP